MGLKIHAPEIVVPRGLLSRAGWVKLLQEVVNQEIRKKTFVDIVLVSDEKLFEMNVQFLQHDTLTDIITFPVFEDDKRLDGELYISLDRVLENASMFKVEPKLELMRVMIHGLLHLAGYKDKRKEEIREMRAREEYWLNAFSGRY